MNRYGAGQDDEFEPDSRRRVLRNYQGITLVREAELIESRLLADAYERSIDEIDTTTRFTEELISRLHCDWLSDLYPMAGRYRTVDLGKGGLMFCHALYVPEQM